MSREEKQRREREAVERIFSALPHGADYLALWEEPLLAELETLRPAR